MFHKPVSISGSKTVKTIWREIRRQLPNEVYAVTNNHTIVVIDQPTAVTLQTRHSIWTLRWRRAGIAIITHWYRRRPAIALAARQDCRKYKHSDEYEKQSRFIIHACNPFARDSPDVAGADLIY
jgi:hypothetical protein